MSIDDPIVEEVRQVRARLWEQCGGDLKRFVAWLREQEAKHPERLVTLDEVRRRSGKVKEPAVPVPPVRNKS